MLMTRDDRIKNRLSVKDIREMGLNFRLIDSYNRITEVKAYATTRQELFDIVESEIAKRGIDNCDLITQEWIKNTYGKNYYHTKPREFFTFENGIIKNIIVRQID